MGVVVAVVVVAGVVAVAVDVVVALVAVDGVVALVAVDGVVALVAVEVVAGVAVVVVAVVCLGCFRRRLRNGLRSPDGLSFLAVFRRCELGSICLMLDCIVVVCRQLLLQR